MTRVVLRVALLALLFIPRAATAQDPRQSAPGQFDFYVLSLSWSPSFCAGVAERGARNANVQSGRDPFLSSFMGCGRNMTTASRSIAKFRPRGLIAAWFPPCST